jgi:hypothetical protein
MKNRDHDLYKKLFSMPAASRADLIQFLEGRGDCERDGKQMFDKLLTSISLKNQLRNVKPN